MKRVTILVLLFIAACNPIYDCEELGVEVYINGADITCHDVRHLLDHFADNMELFYPIDTQDIRKKYEILSISFWNYPLKCAYGLCSGLTYGASMHVHYRGNLCRSALIHELIHYTIAPNDYNHARKDVWDAESDFYNYYMPVCQ